MTKPHSSGTAFGLSDFKRQVSPCMHFFVACNFLILEAQQVTFEEVAKWYIELVPSGGDRL